MKSIRLDNIEHVEVRSDNANHRGRSSSKQYRAVALSDVARLTTSDVRRLSVAYIGPKSRRERPRETQIDTEVALVTGDSDTSFKVKRSKVRSHGAEAYSGCLPHSLLNIVKKMHAVSLKMYKLQL